MRDSPLITIPSVAQHPPNLAEDGRQQHSGSVQGTIVIRIFRFWLLLGAGFITFGQRVKAMRLEKHIRTAESKLQNRYGPAPDHTIDHQWGWTWLFSTRKGKGIPLLCFFLSRMHHFSVDSKTQRGTMLAALIWPGVGTVSAGRASPVGNCLVAMLRTRLFFMENPIKRLCLVLWPWFLGQLAQPMTPLSNLARLVPTIIYGLGIWNLLVTGQRMGALMILMSTKPE